jgi:hypothetical protein
LPPRRLSPTQQPPQQRQFKKIVQRQQDKSRRTSPTSMPSGHNEEMKTRSPTREPEACQHLRRPSNMSEPERRMPAQSYNQQGHTSHGHTSRSMPISGLLSDVPTYVVYTGSTERKLTSLVQQLNLQSRHSQFECVNNLSQLEPAALESGIAESLIHHRFYKWMWTLRMPHPRS